MAFEVETVTEIEALLGTGVDDDWDFEAIEMAARRMAMRVAARAVEQRLNDDTYAVQIVDRFQSPASSSS